MLFFDSPLLSGLVGGSSSRNASLESKDQRRYDSGSRRIAEGAVRDVGAPAFAFSPLTTILCLAYSMQTIPSLCLAAAPASLSVGRHGFVCVV